MTNYVQIAMESLINDNVLLRNISVSQMVAESEFILNSIDEGKVVDFVQEAGLSNTRKKIIDNLKLFIDSIISKFKSKVADYNKKYIPWVKDNADKIKQKAAESSLTLAPYWAANVSKDTTTMTNLPQQAFRYPFDENDIKFASNILTSVKSKDDLNDTAKLSAVLKNKFRFGKEEEDNSKIKKEELKGADLVSKVDEMIKYISDYPTLSNKLSSISNSWKSSAEKFQTAVGESADVLTKDKFILIEMCGLDCTDLSLLEGFDSLPLLEAGDEKTTSLTTVQNNVKEDGSGDEKKDGKNSASRYQLVDKFTRLAFSAFMTACEERFIVYIKCMSQILGESPKVNK